MLAFFLVRARLLIVHTSALTMSCRSVSFAVCFHVLFDLIFSFQQINSKQVSSKDNMFVGGGGLLLGYIFHFL